MYKTFATFPWYYRSKFI